MKFSEFRWQVILKVRKIEFVDNYTRHKTLAALRMDANIDDILADIWSIHGYKWDAKIKDAVDLICDYLKK